MILNPTPSDKVFMLGIYTGHVFFNPKAEQYPLCLHLYDNTQDKVVYVGYFSSPTQLGNQVCTYILDKYKENEIDYDEQFLSVSIESMVDTLDMLCYDKATEDEVMLQNTEYSDFSDLNDLNCLNDLHHNI